MLAMLQRNDRMLGVKRIGRRNIDGIQLLQLAQRRDAVEGLECQTQNWYCSRAASSKIRASDKGKPRRLRDRLRQRSAGGAKTDEADSD